MLRARLGTKERWSEAMKNFTGVFCTLFVLSQMVSAAEQPKKEMQAQPSTVKSTEAKPAAKEMPAKEGEHNIIVTRMGAEIPEQPELEPGWGSYIKKAWPYWRENYWIDRGPWPGANQGILY